MNDEEVAFRIVRLYFKEIARIGFKRSLDLDQMINSYFYALKRLKEKDAALKALAQKIIREEKAKQEVIAPVIKSEASSEKVTTTTVTTVTNNKPN
ncbi:MAG: hypothetical protein WCI04_01740 [archaeon]